MLGLTTGNSDSQDSPQLGLGEAITFPLIIFSAFPPWGPHPNGILSRDSQVTLGIPTYRTFVTLRAHNFACKPLIAWILMQSYSLHRKLSNDMLHIAYTWRNLVDFRLLVVRSQTINLTFGISFDHNLCFKCPNEPCEPILNIWFLIVFQWYKELFKPLDFDPWNCTLKIWESICDSNSHNGSSLGSVQVHSLTLFALPGTCDVTLRPPFWPTTLQPPCLGCEPKTRVATFKVYLMFLK